MPAPVSRGRLPSAAMELVRLPSGLMVGHHRQLLFAFNNDCADVVHCEWLVAR